MFVLLLKQFVLAAMMLNTPPEETVVGFTAGELYNWHKSIGLIVLAVAIARFVWRKTTHIPDWAPNLSGREKRAIHWIERLLYLCMFVMPLSGFVFVMAGDYGVNFFSRWELPRVIPPDERLALLAERTHAVTACLLAGTLVAHWTVGVRHQLKHRDRYLQRMLPF